MKKENTFVYIVIIILFSAFLYVSYTGLPKKDQVSELLWLPNQLDFQTPSPQPAPPPPTPVPTPRQATEESSQKTQLPTNPEAQYYLQPGPYTTPGPEIKAVKITPISSGALKEGQTPTPPDVDQYEFNIIRGIFQYMDAFPSYKTDDDNSWALTVNDIFSKGINENYCGQYGRFFVTLARLYGIPAKYTQTYFTEWAVGQKLNGCWDGTLEGHVYAKVYVNGIELANGFHELLDVKEQRQRFLNDLAKRRKLNYPEVPIDEDLLAALDHGMPACAGVALGVDRLVMLAMGAGGIDEVVSLP